MSFLNVLRWSALGGGVAYGFLHNRTLASQAAEQHEIHVQKKREKLVAEAKQEWLRLHPKPAPSTDGPVTDVDSPDFDVVKLLDWKLKQEA